MSSTTDKGYIISDFWLVNTVFLNNLQLIYNYLQLRKLQHGIGLIYICIY
jgi:hypothetical protein